MRAKLLAITPLASLASGQVFDVMNYGAVGDGKHFDTAAIRAAIAAAASVGGGEVLFRPDFTFLTGCFNVTDNVILNVKGTIVGSPNATDYVLVEPLDIYGGWGMLPNTGQNPTDPREWQPLIQSWHTNNFTLTGGGTVDGNGFEWWNCAGDLSQQPCSGYVRPHGIRLVGTQGVHIYDINIKNMPMWQVHPVLASNVWIHDVNITAPPGSHNTDGIDPDCSQNVMIERVYISTGDDIIAIKAGRDWNGRTYGRPSANITVRDSVFGSGHGLSIGSEMSGGVQNVSFYNLIINGTGNVNLAGIRLKSERGRGGLIENINYNNITLIDLSGQAVQMTLNYDPGVPPTNATATPQMRNVTVANVVAVNPGQGWFIDGLPESPLTEIHFINVSIQNAKKLYAACDNITQSTCENVTPACPPCIAQ